MPKLFDGAEHAARPAPYPLLHAVETGDETQVRKLLDGGCDVNLCDADGWSPIIMAAKEGHGALLALLLTAGADANPPGNGAHTALRGASLS